MGGTGGTDANPLGITVISGWHSKKSGWHAGGTGGTACIRVNQKKGAP